KTRFGNSASITAFLAFSAQRRKATAPKRRSALKETNIVRKTSVKYTPSDLSNKHKKSHLKKAAYSRHIKFETP
ncbi:MAG: hypothetical protein M0P26_08005, partial [Bacteroidales bacterium]|nr:hypothetical protein [Bacteroidales bacterium]